MSGFVYYIVAPEYYVVKIGKANKPFQRLSEMQVAHWTKLEIYALIRTPNPDILESELHLYYRRYKLRGEWFTTRWSATKNENAILKHAEAFGLYATLEDGPWPNALQAVRRRCYASEADPQALALYEDV